MGNQLPAVPPKWLVFTAEEWRTLQFAPLWVFTAVAGVDSKIDDKEKAALAKELADAQLYKEPLVRDVLTSLCEDLPGNLQAYGADARSIERGLGDVRQLLTKVSAGEAEAFKRGLLFIGHNIAKASGGWLFGLGDKVSKDEKKALVVIAMLLEVQL